MIVVKKPLYLFCFILLTACDFAGPTFATREQRKQAMHNARFDQTIISDIYRYNDLKNFLHSYSDTIISYRDSRNYMDTYDGNKTETVLQRQDCYSFSEGNSSDDITDIPDFLKPKLDSILSTLGDTAVRSFKVCKDKKINIDVRLKECGNGLYIFHNLIWNSKIERDYSYIDSKDTLINRDCVYRIGLIEDHGH